MKQIFASVAVIAFVGVVVAGGTGAFFSDSETSTGNTFTAGSIDLALGSDYNSEFNGSGEFVLDSTNNGRALFAFDDLKPGDMGSVGYLMEVTSNDAYVCAQASIDSKPENGLIDPESDAGDTSGGTNGGELQNYVQFATFDDNDADGEYDADGSEAVNVNQYGGGDSNGFTVAEFSSIGWVSVADTNAPSTWLIEDSVVAGDTESAGMLYCFGDFKKTGDVIECEVPAGADYNDAQTDIVNGGITFFSTQKRNNDDFVCSDLNPVFVLTDASEQNALNKAAGDKPYFKYTIDGDEITFELVNPRSFPAYFDYQVDGEAGTTYGFSTDIIPSGPLAGQPFGDIYNSNTVSANSTSTITVSGTSEIRIGIHFGPEQDDYLDWATFTAS